MAKPPTVEKDRRRAGRKTEPAVWSTDAVKVYGAGDTAVRALDGVTVGFARESFSAIMGPSGSGKSTLLHCMAGLDTLSGGSVHLGGIDLTTLDDAGLTALRRDKVGFIFQAFNLVPTLTALENITLPQDIAGRKPDTGWVDTVIDTVHLRDRLTHRPNQLSGGEQQRVAAARALAGRPEVVFADEPTGNLNTTASTELLGFMREAVQRFGQTIVMVTHDPVSAAFAERVVFLRDGRVVGELRDPTRKRILESMKELEI